MDVEPCLGPSGERLHCGLCLCVLGLDPSVLVYVNMIPSSLCFPEIRQNLSFSSILSAVVDLFLFVQLDCSFCGI